MAILLRTMNIFSFIMTVRTASVVSVLLHLLFFLAVFHIFAKGFKEYFSQRIPSPLISPYQ